METFTKVQTENKARALSYIAHSSVCIFQKKIRTALVKWFETFWQKLEVYHTVQHVFNMVLTNQTHH